MSLPEPHLCGRCRRPLDWHQPPEGPGWWTHPSTPHPGVADGHAPEPIPASRVANEMVGTCDFCTAVHPQWVYPCTDFTITAPGVPGYGSVGNWAACGVCAELIERGHWDKLARRALARHPAPSRRLLAPFVARLHAGFRQHRAGDRQAN